MPKKNTLLAGRVGRGGHALNPPGAGLLSSLPRLHVHDFSLLRDLFGRHGVVSGALKLHRSELRSGKEILLLACLQETANRCCMPHRMETLDFLRRTAERGAIQKMRGGGKSPFVGGQQCEHIDLNTRHPPELRSDFGGAVSGALPRSVAEAMRRMAPKPASHSTAEQRARCFRRLQCFDWRFPAGARVRGISSSPSGFQYRRCFDPGRRRNSRPHRL